MKFEVQCDINDGIVLMDPAYFKDMNEDILNAMNIFLDPNDVTELVDDFPDEEWTEVYERETAPLKEFIESGKMWIYLMDPGEKEFVLEETDSDKLTGSINIESGKLIVVMAGELLQCLYYPDLEMETIGELELENGSYRIGLHADGMIGIKRC